MLRPSKIFVSLHQLRHYCQLRISELVNQPQHQVFQFTTTQQMIVFFSDIQQTLIKKAYSTNATSVIKSPNQDKFLIRMIQQHFPMSKVFSSPTLHRRVWATSFPGQHQFRTMMSTTSPGNGPATATTFLTWGFPRSTAVVGFGRNSPAFAARQFSTTKSPCVTLFQNTTNTTGQTNVFSHISSRIFSPAGTKMNQPDLNEKQSPKHPTVSSLSSSTVSNGDEAVDDIYYNRIFATQKNMGMGELINHSDECMNQDEYHHSSKHFIRRESVSSTNGNAQQKRKHHMNRRKLDSIIHHDELSSPYRESTLPSRTQTNNSRKKLYGSNRLKQPPDQNHVKRRDDQESNKKKHSPLNSSTFSSVYLLITLDTTQFLNDCQKDWSTQRLNTSFVDAIEQMAYEYQIHINYVLKLLDKLHKHGKFRVVARQSELRVYFPFALESKQDAINFLKDAKIVDISLEKQNVFTIVSEDHEFIVSSDQNEDQQDDDYQSIVGPEYFKDLQLFLDHTDYLIETSPAFASNGRR